ncbi:hypothetical protein [Shimia sagamensis]|uniref:hypothetical protein n=1 Tax=Shimia sagamensis TaxID=1566352 RepID=UPI0024B78F03|nr:hypothetical protein [Shimia sagamensis]
MVYFDATVGTQPSGFQGAELISDRAFANWSKEDLAAVHGDIQSRKTSQKVQTLAMQTAQVSICASGTVALDDRVVRENVPLSAAESARVQSALGGDLDNLLGKTQQELDQAGIGYLGKRETRVVPNLRYVTHRRSGENMAKLRLKCVY